METKEYRLTDVCDFQGGTQPPKEEWITEPRDGYVRMLQIRDFTQDKAEHVGYVKDTKKLNKCEEDDILIGRYGASVGKILTGLAGAYNVAIIKTIPNEELLSKRYLYYVLTGTDFQNFILNIGARAAQAGFNKSDLSLFKLYIPTSLDDQERIAEVLEKTKNLIDNRRKSIDMLDNFLKMKFLEIFANLHKNENGWRVKRLGDISEIQGGLQITPKRDKHLIERPYLRVANIYRNRLNLDEIKYIRVTSAEEKRIALKKGDILVVEGHGNINEIGRAAVWDGSIANCLHQNHLIRVRVKSDYVLPVFISDYLNSDRGKMQMLKASKTTSGLNTISSKNVKDINILIPPLPIQDFYVKIVEQSLEIQEQYNSHLLHLEKLFESLSHKSLKGKLEISEKALIKGTIKIQPKISGEIIVIDRINKDLEEFHKSQPHTGAPDDIDNTIRQLEAELKIKGEIPFWDEYVKYRIVKGKFKEPFTFDELWKEITKFPFETVPEYDEVATLLFKWLAEENAFIRQQFNESTKQIELIVNETAEA